METQERVLRVSDVLALAQLADAAIHGRKVRWLTDSGEVAEGIARSIGDDQGYFLGPDDDIRDGYLRITTLTGFELFRPIKDLVGMIGQHTFVVEVE